MSNKLFDSVIIASDNKQRNKVRFCNDLAKRLEILKRDNFTVTFSKQFDQQYTKRELLDKLNDILEQLSEDDRDAIDEAYELFARRNVATTKLSDVMQVIDLDEIKNRQRIAV
jgi:crotonobetainyl-CoA:carnitine CoA-transferase CaiB-like acyl-CoA transferase